MHREPPMHRIGEHGGRDRVGPCRAQPVRSCSALQEHCCDPLVAEDETDERRGDHGADDKGEVVTIKVAKVRHCSPMRRALLFSSMTVSRASRDSLQVPLYTWRGFFAQKNPLRESTTAWHVSHVRVCDAAHVHLTACCRQGGGGARATCRILRTEECEESTCKETVHSQRICLFWVRASLRTEGPSAGGFLLK